MKSIEELHVHVRTCMVVPLQLFAGDYPQGPQAFCNDPSRRSLEGCLNNPMVRLRVSTSRELLPNPDYSPTIMVPTVWLVE